MKKKKKTKQPETAVGGKLGIGPRAPALFFQKSNVGNPANVSTPRLASSAVQKKSVCHALHLAPGSDTFSGSSEMVEVGATSNFPSTKGVSAAFKIIPQFCEPLFQAHLRLPSLQRLAQPSLEKLDWTGGDKTRPITLRNSQTEHSHGVLLYIKGGTDQAGYTCPAAMRCTAS